MFIKWHTLSILQYWHLKCLLIVSQNSIVWWPRELLFFSPLYFNLPTQVHTLHTQVSIVSPCMSSSSPNTSSPSLSMHPTYQACSCRQHALHTVSVMSHVYSIYQTVIFPPVLTNDGEKPLDNSFLFYFYY